LKLFQIEEPDGSPADPNAPGAAIGIDASGARAEIAVAVGGNAVILADREGFERDLPIPSLTATAEAWQTLFEGARLRAERSLGRPVTHAVLVLAKAPDETTTARLLQAAEGAGLELQLVLEWENPALGAAGRPALAAAVMAEDLAPRLEMP